jgi:hypothetical protein
MSNGSFSDLKRDTLVVLRLKLSRNKFISGYPVTERQIAVCSASDRDESPCLRGYIVNSCVSGLIFRMGFH